MSVHPKKSLEDQTKFTQWQFNLDSEMYNRRKFKYVNDKAAVVERSDKGLHFS